MQSFTATYQFNNLTLLGAKNYYAFGSEMVGRRYVILSGAEGGEYRFGFNGKEKDNSVYGDGNCIAYEARIFDARLGRFMSTDPWTKKYAWQTPYAYYANTPFSKVDWNGFGDNKDGTYTVEKGNTLNSIGKAIGIDPAKMTEFYKKMKSMNKGKITGGDKYKIKAGDKLVLPFAKTKSQASAPRTNNKSKTTLRSPIFTNKVARKEPEAGPTIANAKQLEEKNNEENLTESIISTGVTVTTALRTKAIKILNKEVTQVHAADYKRVGKKLNMTKKISGKALFKKAPIVNIASLVYDISLAYKHDDWRYGRRGISSFAVGYVPWIGTPAAVAISISPLKMWESQPVGKITSHDRICFVYGTKIWAQDGLFEVQNLRINDSVYSFNFVKNKIELMSITFIQAKKTNQLITIYSSSGDEMTSTIEHPYFIKNKGWVAANSLLIGDTLTTAKGIKSIINKIIIEKKLNTSVYNFQVEKNKNYYISENKILVHNKSYIRKKKFIKYINILIKK